MSTRRLQVVAVGTPAFDPRSLGEPMLAVLGVTAAQGKVHLARPSYAFNKDRNQYHSNAVLRRMGALREPGFNFLLGVTDVDLFVPDAPFVFGEADREARVALVSTFRLQPSSTDPKLARRLQVEAAHQTAHLLGLSFCEEPKCLLFVAQSPADVDRKNLGLCVQCRNELARLNR